MADRLSLIIDRLRLEMQSWNSVEMTVRREQTMQNVPARVKDPTVRVEEHYIETKLGQRLLEEVSTSADGKTKRQLDYSDGERCARVFFDASNSHQTQIDITNRFSSEHEIGFTRRPEPFFYYYVGKVPIFDALRTAQPLGEGQAMGRPCDLYLFTGVKLVESPLDAVYYLDQETSAVLKAEFFKAGGERNSSEAIRIWEAKSLDAVDGDHHIAFKSENQFFQKSSAGRLPLLTNTVVIESVHYNGEFDAKTFWPVYQPGVLVNDTIKKTFYRSPATVQTPATTTTGAATLAPTQPWSWESLASPVIVCLGLFIIALAVTIGRRK